MKSKPFFLKSFLLSERVHTELKIILQAIFVQFCDQYFDLKKT